MLTHQETQRGIFGKFFGKKIVVRPFAADSNLLQQTGSVNRTPHTSHFLALACTHFHVARDIGSRCLAHVIHVSSACCCCFFALRFSTLHSSPSLSSSFSFSCSSSFSSMWVGSMRSPMRTAANKDLGTLAKNNPLIGYEPNFIDNYHISETTDIFIQESSSDSKPSSLHNLEFDDYTIGKALSSPLFQEREDTASRRQVYHSPDESLLSSQSSSVAHVRTGRPVFDEFGSLISNVRENSRRNSESEQIRKDSSGTTKRADSR